MVVDDDNEFRLVLLRLLEGTEFRGVGAAGASEAVEAVKKSHPRAILIDWALAGVVDGPSILKALKANPATRHIPVIMISGLKRTESEKLAVQRAGAEGFYAKMDVMDRGGRFLDVLRGVVAKNKAPSSWRLLVIEDDAEVQEFIRFALARREFDVDFASTGREGCVLAEARKPNLIILDMGLPDINGVEVCLKLRGNPATKNIPIIAMSAMDGTGGVLETALRELGAADYLPKPFGENELLQHMSPLLGRMPAARAGGDMLVRGRVRLDADGRRVWTDDRLVPRIGHKQFDLLHVLIKNADGVSRKQLESFLWNGAENSKALNMTVIRLRRVLGFGENEGIIAIPLGYKLVG